MDHYKTLKTSVIMCGSARKKYDPSRPAFHGHSRSLEPTGIDRLLMTSY